MTSTTKNNNSELPPTSPGDDSDVIISPTAEIEQVPGLNGVPVRCTWTSTQRVLYFVNLIRRVFFSQQGMM